MSLMVVMVVELITTMVMKKVMILVMTANEPGKRVWLWWRGRVPGTRRPAWSPLSNGICQVQRHDDHQNHHQQLYHIYHPTIVSRTFLFAKFSSKYFFWALCAQDFLLIYLQCQFVPYKLKFARSGIWLMPLRSPWPWGKDTRIKCSYSIFLVFAIFVFLPSNNFGATNRAWHGLGLMRQKCGCIYQGIILKYLFAKTKCWKYFRSPSNHTKAADTFNFNSTFIALLLTSGSSK